MARSYKKTAKALILGSILNLASPFCSYAQEEPAQDAPAVESSYQVQDPQDQKSLQDRLGELSTELIKAKMNGTKARPYGAVVADIKRTWLEGIKEKAPFLESQDLEKMYNYTIKADCFLERERECYPTQNKVNQNELLQVVQDMKDLRKYLPNFPQEVASKFQDELRNLENYVERMSRKPYWAPCKEDFDFTQSSADKNALNIGKVFSRAYNYMPLDEYGNPIELYKIDRNGWVRHHLNPGIRDSNQVSGDADFSGYKNEAVLHFLAYRTHFKQNGWLSPASYREYLATREALTHMMRVAFKHTEKHTDLRPSLESCLRPEHRQLRDGRYADDDGNCFYSIDTADEMVRSFDAFERITGDIYRENNSVGGFLKRSLIKQPIHVLYRAHINLGHIVEDVATGKIGRLVSKDLWHLMYNYFSLLNFSQIPKGDMNALVHWVLWGAGETSPVEAVQNLVQSLKEIKHAKDSKGKFGALLGTYFNADYIINVPNDIRYVKDVLLR